MIRFTVLRALSAIVALLVALPSAHAENGDAPTQYKIGVVDMKAIFDAYEKQKDEYAKLEKSKEVSQIEIDKLSKKITEARDKYNAEKEAMSEEDIDALEESIESDLGRYQAEFKRSQQEIDRKEKKLLDALFDDIRLAVKTVGAQGNYHLVLEGGESVRGVLYSSSTLNMTGRVIEYLNAAYQKEKTAE